jgi:hypothetical protein
LKIMGRRALDEATDPLRGKVRQWLAREYDVGEATVWRALRPAGMME